MVKLADDYMEPGSMYKDGDAEPLKPVSHPTNPHPEHARKFPTFQSRIFLVEECKPVNGKFVPTERHANHKKLRQERLGLTLQDVARALSISLTQANDLEQGRLKCDWKLAAKTLKEYAEGV